MTLTGITYQKHACTNRISIMGDFDNVNGTERIENTLHVHENRTHIRVSPFKRQVQKSRKTDAPRCPPHY